MKSATSIVHSAAGAPLIPDGVDGICAMCGCEGTGVTFADWVRPSFMDYDKLKLGTITCQACAFCCEDGSVLLQEKLGRDKPQRMRNYSHFVIDSEWAVYHKGQKREILHMLRRSPDVAVIALSGQKHILFRARPGWWQIEEQALLPCLSTLERLVAIVEDILAFFSKTEIESGYYAQSRVMKCGVARWKAAEDELKRGRGSLVFQLAVWLAQKDNADGTGTNP